jgi:dsRNA-specific ribonuclease
VLLGPVPHEVTPLQSQAKRMLQERLQKYFAKAPTYQIEQTGGSLHAPIFTAYVLWGKHILGESTGTNKKEATEAAARNALDKLPSHDHDCMDYFRKHYS